jgi:hypothetical protein
MPDVEHLDGVADPAVQDEVGMVALDRQHAHADEALIGGVVGAQISGVRLRSLSVASYAAYTRSAAAGSCVAI